MTAEKSYLCPLFWQHHEDKEILRRELRQMKENGIGGFIAESRPHPDYLGSGWWEDMELLVQEAKRLGLKMWIFDDGSYPSGTANGLIGERYPQYTKRYLAVQYVDAIGPARERGVLIDQWLEDGERFLCAVAGRRLDHDARFSMDSLIDVTGFVQDGILYWDIPEGEWRIFICKVTGNGGEEWTKNYLNPLDPEGTRAFLDLVYEEHYRHLGADFGDTIQGFFTDEPRFGNSPGYDRLLGDDMVLPWSETLLEELAGEAGCGKSFSGNSPCGDSFGGFFSDFVRLLPALWFDCGERTADVRYRYMDVVSRRFGKNFIGQMGDWCREHGVRLIGHVIEENGSHARLGYGPGHYFRAMDGLDMAGIDVVNNIYPGRRDGRFLTHFNNYDAQFNHWGLSKMASSCAHLDPRKRGNSVCEAFGAYGWSEGLKTMKWITDAMCVRGINHIIPHAFSPREFPDPDCPPHFYAGGNNPQFRLFSVWADYANRVCARICDGVHVASAAVLYHGESEWGGACDPFEKAVKALMLRQIDCDVVPGDWLVDRERSRVEDGRLKIAEESFGALIVPYAQYLPGQVTKRLQELAAQGIAVVFAGDFPKRSYLGEKFEPVCGMKKAAYDELAGMLTEMDLRDIEVEDGGSYGEYLVFSHYRQGERDSYFLTNESLFQKIEAEVCFRDERQACFYDPMTGEFLEAHQRRKLGKDGEKTVVSLLLRPYESVFVVFGETGVKCGKNRRMYARKTGEVVELPAKGWEISVSGPLAWPEFTRTEYTETGSLAAPGRLPEFSGTVRYRMQFEARVGRAVLSLGEAYEAVQVWVNGRKAGDAICPPYLFFLEEGMLQDGENELVAEVTNTLAKAHHDNVFDRYWVQEPAGLLGPVKVEYVEE
ncbi:glycosyl hydrolase [Eisenbergiella porci]|uniref:glycosyl hydrolase n=1 Tax=Eisenbergiella porci TaxID=2652274 RepID=UPI002A841A89|nr:glycosyl hydrolase [Eisenbergiella porci]